MDLKYTVTREDEEYQLSIKDLLKKHFDFSSRFRGRIKRENLIFLNGNTARLWVSPKEKDVISIKLPKERNNFIGENIPIDVIFEDDHLLVINKNSGIVSHPTKGKPNRTLSNAIAYRMDEKKEYFKIRFVNRIDMDTSGIIIVAKNSYVQDILTKEMQDKTLLKNYTALVKGIVEDDEGTINLPLGKMDEDSVKRSVMDGGKESITHYKVIKRFDGYSLLFLSLETGRTHQIRVHLSHIGYPIVGDYLYGGYAPKLIDRQCLHASNISFIHPIKKERVSLEAPLPLDIQNVLDSLST